MSEELRNIGAELLQEHSKKWSASELGKFDFKWGNDWAPYFTNFGMEESLQMMSSLETIVFDLTGGFIPDNLFDELSRDTQSSIPERKRGTGTRTLSEAQTPALAPPKEAIINPKPKTLNSNLPPGRTRFKSFTDFAQNIEDMGGPENLGANGFGNSAISEEQPTTLIPPVQKSPSDSIHKPSLDRNLDRDRFQQAFRDENPVASKGDQIHQQEKDIDFPQNKLPLQTADLPETDFSSNTQGANHLFTEGSEELKRLARENSSEEKEKPKSERESGKLPAQNGSVKNRSESKSSYGDPQVFVRQTDREDIPFTSEKDAHTALTHTSSFSFKFTEESGFEEEKIPHEYDPQDFIDALRKHLNEEYKRFFGPL